jgi:hypothetical protein
MVELDAEVLQRLSAYVAHFMADFGPIVRRYWAEGKRDQAETENCFSSLYRFDLQGDVLRLVAVLRADRLPIGVHWTRIFSSFALAIISRARQGLHVGRNSKISTRTG